MTLKPYNRINTTAELRRTAAALDNPMFSPGTMAYFDSRLIEGIYRAPYSSGTQGYFVTSEQFSPETPRTYTVRKFEIESYQRATDGRTCDRIVFDTISEFEEHPTASKARAAARFIAGLPAGQ